MKIARPLILIIIVPKSRELSYKNVNGPNYPETPQLAGPAPGWQGEPRRQSGVASIRHPTHGGRPEVSRCNFRAPQVFGPDWSQKCRAKFQTNLKPNGYYRPKPAHRRPFAALDARLRWRPRLLRRAAADAR